MELKDLILETLNELSDSNEDTKKISLSKNDSTAPSSVATLQQGETLREECEFLEMLQERLLVLFEGLNAPHNQNIQSRLNITINFLEYQLSVINERLNDIKT